MKPTSDQVFDPVLVAKMQLYAVTSTETVSGKQSEQLILTATDSTDGTANSSWASHFTPTGKLELHISNPEAFGKVKPGFYKVLLVPCGESE